MADYKSINTLDNGEGGGSTDSASLNHPKLFSVPTYSEVNNYPVWTPGNDEDASVTQENGLRSINDFKSAADLINSTRTEVKTEMQNLTKNLYSTLNQINFGFKLVLDTNNYLTRYTTNNSNLKDKLKEALENGTTENPVETSIDMYNNVIFNNLFIGDILYFENFMRLLQEAISYYLVVNGDVSGYTVTVQTIYDFYCEKYFIKNEWDITANAYNRFKSAYEELLDVDHADAITYIALGDRTESQKRLIDEYEDYKNAYSFVKMICEPESHFTFSEIEDLINGVQYIINFKNVSTLYSRYLDRIEQILNDTSNLFLRLFDAANRLIEYNVEYQSNFEAENIYLKGITDVCNYAIDILSTLQAKYPNRNTKQELITDSNFTQLLNIINNIYTRELSTLTELVALASKDYKLISSLETFITPDDVIDNSVLYNIMANFDRDMIEADLSRLVRLYFKETGNDVTPFGNGSFTRQLVDYNYLTDPFYDILAYYRIILFGFTDDITLVFDFLETMHLFKKNITSDKTDKTMAQMFDIKINNIDFVNVNRGKINETITSRFAGLKELDFFDINPYMDAIKASDVSTLTSMVDVVNLFSPLKGYDLILFAITENILYNDIDIGLVMDTLSKRLNIRTQFFLLMFYIAIDKVIETIEAYYSNDVPDNLTIYNELVKYSVEKISGGVEEDKVFGPDLEYLALLLKANDYYFGVSDIFNITKVRNFALENDKNDVWASGQVNNLNNLFSVYRGS